jgi:hypothetical protein
MPPTILRHTRRDFIFSPIKLLCFELARLTQPSTTIEQQPCSETATTNGQASPVPASVAVSHYGCMRRTYLNSHPANGPQDKGPQIIAWSAADDLLSWYVPNISEVTVVNLAAHNSGFHIPKVVASPSSIHDNYAKNPAVVREIFGQTVK